MRFEHRKILYIVFGLIPGLIPLILASLGFGYGVFSAIQSIFNAEYNDLISIVPLAIFCASALFSYICGYIVIFKKEKIIKIRTVISGLVLGVIVCAAYSLAMSAEPLLLVTFLLPAIVGISLVIEIIPREDNEKCT